MSLTCTAVHVPPRAVLMPRAVNARATPRSDCTPLAWIVGDNVNRAAATRFSDAGNIDLITHTAHLKDEITQGDCERVGHDGLH
jgi:hypothetical protein